MYKYMLKTHVNMFLGIAVWLRELKPGLDDNLEGLDGVGGGREV